MTRNLFSWIIATILAAAAGYYQYVTGPSHPVKETGEFASVRVECTLPTVHQGTNALKIPVIAPHTSIHGRLIYMETGVDDQWRVVPIDRQGDRLVAVMPGMTNGSKFEYYIELYSGMSTTTFPREGTVRLRYRSQDPFYSMWGHIIIMLCAILFAFRSGIEGIYEDGQNKNLTLFTLLLLISGGVVLGPITHKFLYNQTWNGIPFGLDITDNKVVLLVVLWTVATFKEWNRPAETDVSTRSLVAIAAWFVTALVMLIPHSYDPTLVPSPRLGPGVF